MSVDQHTKRQLHKMHDFKNVYLHCLFYSLNQATMNLFSVFISHVMKTKNRNRSINKFKNLEYDR